MKKFISVILLLTIMFSVLPNVFAWRLPFEYDDVHEEDWFYSYIEYDYEKGLIGEADYKLYSPNEPITRYDFVTAIGRAARNMGLISWDNTINKQKYPHKFVDVSDVGSYPDFINWAAYNGIINGYSDTIFGPDDAMTREQAAKVLVKFANVLGYDLNEGENVGSQFSDIKNVSRWAEEPVNICLSNRIIQGYGDFTIRPQKYITRAEAAKIIYMLAEVCGIEIPDATDNPRISD